MELIDLKKEVRIKTEKELLIYSYRVAGTVGLMMAKIFGVKRKISAKSYRFRYCYATDKYFKRCN